jgi:hypothetical protein
MLTVGGTEIAEGRHHNAALQAGTLALQAAVRADTVTPWCGTFWPFHDRLSDDGLSITAGQGRVR